MRNNRKGVEKKKVISKSARDQAWVARTKKKEEESSKKDKATRPTTGDDAADLRKTAIIENAAADPVTMTKTKGGHSLDGIFGSSNYDVT